MRPQQNKDIDQRKHKEIIEDILESSEKIIRIKQRVT